MGNPRYRNGHRRRQTRARFEANQEPCYLCGRPIDYTLTNPHPLSMVVDEIIPLARGGTLTPDNQAPAHRWCNSIKGTNSAAWAKQEIQARLYGRTLTPVKATSLPFTTSIW